MSVMETEYRQFRSSDSTPVYEREHSMPAPKGLKSVVAYFLYGVLVLLLLILLMVTGIKCTFNTPVYIYITSYTLCLLINIYLYVCVKVSQLNKDISDVKLQLQSINKAGSTSGSHSSPIVQDVPLKSVAPVKGLCREGWSSYQRSCYLLSTSGLVWHQADQQCRTHGGHLLVLNSMEELDFISQIVELRFNYWIGLVEREEDHWTWVDGTFFNSTQAFWDEGQPDNWDFRENGEDCGQLHASLTRKRKRWNDADCGLQYRYICERSV